MGQLWVLSGSDVNHTHWGDLIGQLGGATVLHIGIHVSPCGGIKKLIIPAEIIDIETALAMALA